MSSGKQHRISHIDTSKPSCAVRQAGCRQCVLWNRTWNKLNPEPGLETIRELHCTHNCPHNLTVQVNPSSGVI